VLSSEFSETEYASVCRHKEGFIVVIMLAEKDKLSASLHVCYIQQQQQQQQQQHLTSM